MLKLVMSTLIFLSSMAAFAHEGEMSEEQIQKTAEARAEQNAYFTQLEEDIRNGVPVDAAASMCQKYISGISQAPLSRVITLTFDDGPHSKFTPQILDVLKAHGIKATFFIMGKNAVSNSGIIYRMIKEGHLVANHSYSHQNFKEIDPAAQKVELERADKILNQYMPYNFKLFRYPYGNATCNTNELALKDGYSGIVGWHIDSCDWAFSTKGYVSDKQATTCGVAPGNKANFAAHVVAQAKKRDGGIILLHDIQSNTAANLNEIIIRLKRDGFSFTNLDEPKMLYYFWPHHG